MSTEDLFLEDNFSRGFSARIFIAGGGAFSLNFIPGVNIQNIKLSLQQKVDLKWFHKKSVA